MAEAAEPPCPKSLVVQYRGTECKLLLFDGVEAASLVHALSSFFKLGEAAFHLVMCDGDAVVPLSSALPDGLKLTLHIDDVGMVRQHPRRRMCSKSVSPINSASAPPLDVAMASPTAHAGTVASSVVPAPGATCATQLGSAQASGVTNSFSASEPLLATASWLVGSDGSVPSDNVEMGAAENESSPRHPEQGFYRQYSNSTEGRALFYLDTDLDARSNAEAHQSVVGCAVAMQDVADAVDRLSRLATELANERTLLAWIRTGLSAIRTVLAFFGLTAAVAFWRNSIVAAQAAMMTVVLFAAFSGTFRYNKIREVLRSPEITQDFGRVSLRWFNALVTITFIGAAVCVYSQHWMDIH